MNTIKWLCFSLLSLGAFISCESDSLDAGNTVQKQKYVMSADINGDVKLPPKPEKKTKAMRLTTEGSANGLNAFLKYEEGQDMPVQVLLGMQIEDKKAVAFIDLPDRKVNMSMGKPWVSLHYKGKIFDFSADNGFMDAYVAAPEKMKAYVAILAGGGANLKPTTHPTVPGPNAYYVNTQDIGFWTPSGLRGGDNDKVVMLNPGTKDVTMNVPLTTQRWIPIDAKRVEFDDARQRWNINLHQLTFNLLPHGQLVGFVYQTERPVYLNAIRLKTEGDWHVPSDVNLRFDTEDFESDSPLICRESYSLTNLNHFSLRFNNHLIEGQKGKPSYGKPVYFWTYGTKGRLTVEANITPKDEPGKQYIVTDGKNKIGEYYLDDYGWKSYTRQINMENGKSYVYLINVDGGKVMDMNDNGLIITEMHHNNRSGLRADNYSLIEVYNPTDRDIDLRYYGLIRTTGYDFYHRVNYGDYMFDMSQAAVQMLFEGTPGQRFTASYFNHEVTDMNGNGLTGAENNRVYVLDGTFDGKLGPHQTAIYAAGHWAEHKDDFYDANSPVPATIRNSIKSAIESGECRFIVSVDNGDRLNGQSNGSSSSGKKAGVLQHASSHGFVLVRRDNLKNYVYKPVDALGVTKFDNDKWSEVEKSKNYMAVYGPVRIYANQEDTPFNWIRRVSDNEPNLKFYSRQTIVNDGNGHYTPFFEETSVWYNEFFDGKDRQPRNGNSSMGRRNYK